MYILYTSEAYNKGWRISDTQDPHWRCLTPLNFLEGTMLVVVLLFRQIKKREDYNVRVAERANQEKMCVSVCERERDR